MIVRPYLSFLRKISPYVVGVSVVAELVDRSSGLVDINAWRPGAGRLSHHGCHSCLYGVRITESLDYWYRQTSLLLATAYVLLHQIDPFFRLVPFTYPELHTVISSGFLRTPLVLYGICFLSSIRRYHRMNVFEFVVHNTTIL
jgi:hypothetical protein